VFRGRGLGIGANLNQPGAVATILPEASVLDARLFERDDIGASNLPDAGKKH
jgi:hypothetical protein